jgi:hypothetical protein
MTQTAVEFLLKWINDNLSESLIPIHVKEQAKDMERKQIIDAHVSGYDSSGESAEDYYKFFYDKTNG